MHISSNRQSRKVGSGSLESYLTRFVSLHKIWANVCILDLIRNHVNYCVMWSFTVSCDQSWLKSYDLHDLKCHKERKCLTKINEKVKSKHVCENWNWFYMITSLLINWLNTCTTFCHQLRYFLGHYCIQFLFIKRKLKTTHPLLMALTTL